MPKLPWIKYFPQDVSSDPGLARCDAATRGIWWDALNAMMLSGTSRISGTVEELARLCRCRRDQMQAAIAEFKRFTVADVQEQNGNITLTNRRLDRELSLTELRRKAGVASAANRQQTRQHTSASASASVSASVLLGGMGGADRTKFDLLKSNLCRLFNRPETEPWGYIEDYTLSQISARPQCADEFETLKRFKAKAEFFPQSIQSLLENWQKTLDRSRNENNPKTRKPGVDRNKGTANEGSDADYSKAVIRPK